MVRCLRSTTSPPIVDLPVAKIRIDVVESNGPAFIAAKASSLEGLEAVSRDWQANTRRSASGQKAKYSLRANYVFCGPDSRHEATTAASPGCARNGSRRKRKAA